MLVVPIEPPKNNLVDSNIQRTFKVVNSIADDESKFMRKGFFYRDLKTVLSSLNLLVDVETAKISRSEGTNA